MVSSTKVLIIKYKSGPRILNSESKESESIDEFTQMESDLEFLTFKRNFFIILEKKPNIFQKLTKIVQEDQKDQKEKKESLFYLSKKVIFSNELLQTFLKYFKDYYDIYKKENIISSDNDAIILSKKILSLFCGIPKFLEFNTIGILEL